MAQNDENTTEIDNVLINSKSNILKIGFHKGSIISRINDKDNSIIFSDFIEISEHKVILEGLTLGVKGAFPISFKGKFVYKTHGDIAYSVRMNEDIISSFDQARFNTSFPYMISLLNTQLLYHASSKDPVNHLNFVRGEIINHPIVLLYNDSILVGDRIVVDNQGYPVFYDAFLIKNSESAESSEPMSFSYEPIFRMNIHFIKYILILGVEMLK